MREDLLNLTPDAVAALANRGLVNRALKEIGEGKGPRLTEEADGTVVSVMVDAGKELVSRLPVGKSLKEGSCSCGASTVCRHRVAAALAYVSFVSTKKEVTPYKAWTPAAIEDTALKSNLGDRIWKKAVALRKKGLVVDIRFPSEEDNVGTARLPTCTVRFLGSPELTCAKCDCQLGCGCEHIALAVWAFKEQPWAKERLDITVEIHPEKSDFSRNSEAEAALKEACSLGRLLLVEGVVNCRPSLAQKFGLVRQQFLDASCVWPGVLLTELEDSLSAYQAGSSLYSAAGVVEILAGLGARLRALSGQGEQPPLYVLGEGEKLETKLELVQLGGLGCRVFSDKRSRMAEIYLVNSDTAEVMVLEKTWNFPEGTTPPVEPLDGPTLAMQSTAGSIKLSQLARGTLKTYVAKRHANRKLLLGAGRQGRTEAGPAAYSWSSVPVPIRITDLSALAQSWESRPPKLIRPRLLVEDLHVIGIQEIQEIRYDPGEQQLFIEALSSDGQPLTINRVFRSVAPQALEVMVAAAKGRYGKICYISGELKRESGRFVLDLVAFQTEDKGQVRVVVPDIESTKDLLDLPVMINREPASLIPMALKMARSVLEEAVQTGMAGLGPRWVDAAKGAAKRLSELGLVGIGARFERLVECYRRERGELEFEESGKAWEEAAIYLLLAMELGG